PAAKGRARNPLERLRVVRVATRGAGVEGLVQDERDPGQRGSLGQAALELDSQAPAVRGPGLEQRVGARGAQGGAARRAEKRPGAAVQDAFRRAERQDE